MVWINAGVLLFFLLEQVERLTVDSFDEQESCSPLPRGTGPRGRPDRWQGLLVQHCLLPGPGPVRKAAAPPTRATPASTQRKMLLFHSRWGEG